MTFKVYNNNPVAIPSKIYNFIKRTEYYLLLCCHEVSLILLFFKSKLNS
ncbi:MAG: hypothetical protein FWH29_02300 [Methanobrevibacter sp.]|nr:hypothetical protein [Methanobrevibacter sp.]